jgi:hypothetical protein
MREKTAPRSLKRWVWGPLCLAIAGLATPALAAGDPAGQFTEQITPNGFVNWTTGVATATGLGVPPRNPVSALQSKEMTRTAAWSVALRNLLEVVKGIQVDSHTTVQSYVTTSTEVQTRVEGLVQGAKLVGERELPTGEFETTVQIKLAGQLSESVIPKGPKVTSPNMRYQQVPPPAKPKVPYTGLVIDARGTGARAALAPRIMTQEDEIYGPDRVDKKFISGPAVAEPGRIAWYFTDEAKAQKHYKVIANPLIIKALRATGENNTDLVIEDSNAEYIEALPEHHAFLTQAKVLILVDPM